MRITEDVARNLVGRILKYVVNNETHWHRVKEAHLAKDEIAVTTLPGCWKGYNNITGRCSSRSMGITETTQAEVVNDYPDGFKEANDV